MNRLFVNAISDFEIFASKTCKSSKNANLSRECTKYIKAASTLKQTTITTGNGG